jgi:hypothetical protein
MTFTKDDSGKYYEQMDMSKSFEIVKPDDQK